MDILTVPGRLPGDKCPSCRKGLLIAVCVTKKGSNDIYGHGGIIWDDRIIDRVACTNCSLSYETNMRGWDIESYILIQVEKAHDPKKRPDYKCCPTHPNVPPTEAEWGGRRARLERRKYRFCQACLKVYWVGESEDEQNLRELAKSASPELKSAVKRLVKSMDKVGRRIRQARST